MVVDKSARRDQLDRLHREGVGVRQNLLGDLEFWGPPEGGRPPIIHPSHIPGHRALEPVRVAGWRRKGNEQVPLLHAKLAVCCAAYTSDLLVSSRVWEPALDAVCASLNEARPRIDTPQMRGDG